VKNAHTNDRRLEHIERMLSSSSDPMLRPIPPDELAVLNALETQLTYGPDDPRQREQFELIIARALEERGLSAICVAETLAGWMATYDEFKEEGERQRRERRGEGGIAIG
jgi:hypothetical protein